MINSFLSGATMLAAAAIGLFFVRSWKRNGDRFFLLFGLAFSLMALERVILALVPPAYEFRPLVYLIRLTAFLLILAAIADKNRGSNRR